MQRLVLCFMVLAIFYSSPVMAVEAVLPISVQIISAETWQKMQQSNLQTPDANSDAEPTAVTTETNSQPSAYDSFTEDSFAVEEDAFYDTNGEEVTTYQPSASDYTISKTFRLFLRLDTNKDSIITIEEYMSRGGRRATEDSFTALDEDGSGWLSIAELSAF